MKTTHRTQIIVAQRISAHRTSRGSRNGSKWRLTCYNTLCIRCRGIDWHQI
uniref:Uncharacterized protein n=1 Tax=Anguilla anguilla TaxID=7936 RepID=A0A0E9UKT6_ANGAN